MMYKNSKIKIMNKKIKPIKMQIQLKMKFNKINSKKIIFRKKILNKMIISNNNKIIQNNRGKMLKK